jgi:hypothetical protein
MRWSAAKTQKLGTLEAWLGPVYRVRGPFSRSERAWLTARTGFADYMGGVHSRGPSFGYLMPDGSEAETQEDKTQPGNWFEGPFAITKAETLELKKMSSAKR